MSDDELEKLRVQLRQAQRRAAEAPNVVLLERCDRQATELVALRAAAERLCGVIEQLEKWNFWRRDCACVEPVIEQAKQLRAKLGAPGG